jgi:hypothetical protein
MIYISHRGNVNEKNIEFENTIEYIDNAINKDFDVEIDVWYLNNNFYLGHDKPDSHVKLSWLLNNASKLWIHCKNVDTIMPLKEYEIFNFFWHQQDKVALTSKQYIWAYPGQQPICQSIAVLPEMFDDDISQCIGICSDIIGSYRDSA